MASRQKFNILTQFNSKSADETAMGIQPKQVSYRLIMKQFALQVGLLVLTVLILFTFQNCAPPVEEQEDGSSQGGKLDLPFAYQTKFDHFAYMSCSNSATGGDSSFFTFRLGAFNAGSGIRLRNEFLNATKGMDRASALANSILNSGVLLQTSIRNSATSAHGWGNVTTSLSVAPYSTALASANGSYVNFGSGISGSINLANSYSNKVLTEENAQYYRDYLSAPLENGGGFVAATYVHPSGSAAYALGPDLNNPMTMYGSGFRMTFKRPNSGIHARTTGPARVLEVVYEASLESVPYQADPAPFACSANYVFAIVRFEDRDQGIYLPNRPCFTGIVESPIAQEDNPGTSAADIDAYNTLRNILPKNEWAIDAVNRCIVSRKQNVSCYGPLAAGTRPVYNPALSCNPATNTCPHFVSVCKR